MPFLLLILLTVVCLPEPRDRSAPPEWLGNQGALILTWVNLLAVAAVAAFLAWRTRRSLAAHPVRREDFLLKYPRWRFYHLMGLIAVYAISLFYFGWGRVASFPLGEAYGSPPGVELIILSPFIFGLVLSWTFFYDVEKAIHEAGLYPSRSPQFWSRFSYITFHARQNLALVVVPVLLVISVKNLPRVLPQLVSDSEEFGTIAAATCALVVLALMPWVMRLILGLKRLPDGPLRERLGAASRRLKFRCSGILLWNTRSGMANAMVVGVIPWLRYVVLTDRLIAEMTPEEVEAVFGHEVGHVKHHHMSYYMAFLTVSLFVVWEAVNLVVGRVADPQALKTWLEQSAHRDLNWVPLVVLLGTYIVVVFGFVSRRCERQADVYGCRAVSCGQPDCSGHDMDVALSAGGRGLCATGIRTFISALDKVAILNGISRDKPGWLRSWQHSTIARRIDFLQRVLADRGVERRFQRRVGLIKWLLFLGLGGLLLLLALAWDKQPAQPGAEDDRPGASAPASSFLVTRLHRGARTVLLE
jgi:STE24 endopeptidase